MCSVFPNSLTLQGIFSSFHHISLWTVSCSYRCWLMHRGLPRPTCSLKDVYRSMDSVRLLINLLNRCHAMPCHSIPFIWLNYLSSHLSSNCSLVRKKYGKINKGLQNILIFFLTYYPFKQRKLTSIKT